MSELLNNKQVAYALLVGGVVLALLAVLLDPIRGYDIYLGGAQIVALIVGIIVALIGAYLAFMYQGADA